jgi:hypothetical protein
MKDYNSPFADDDLQNTALWNTLHACADEQDYVNADFSSMVYEYLDKTPRTSLVVELVNQLNKIGYKIVKA